MEEEEEEEEEEDSRVMEVVGAVRTCVCRGETSGAGCHRAPPPSHGSCSSPGAASIIPAQYQVVW